MKIIKVGLIGFGTIGEEVAEYLVKNRAYLKEKSGVRFELSRIAERETKKVPSKYKKILTSKAEDIIKDKSIDVVIELIGGIKDARKYILGAFRSKKHVITANKALLAEDGKNLFIKAKENGVALKFEASVCGGIPVIDNIVNSLAANDIQYILGIVNGTSNYILTVMEEQNASMKEALDIAKGRGYAESNPSLDLEGIDSSHKLAVIARLAFGFSPDFSKIYKEGITFISNLDIRYAKELGYRIKLLLIARRSSGGLLEARVHPVLLPLDHMLSSVKGVFNALFIEGDLTGEMLFYGKGAGSKPTTSAVIADLISLAAIVGEKGFSSYNYIDARIKGLKDINDIDFRYYIRFMALDKPGVLAKISGVLSSYGISIANVTQKDRARASSVPIVMMTHKANEKNMRKALTKIERLDVIVKRPISIRVER
ncbi:MAG: homoserine dehydrogenase [Candidatus Kaelpia aquatica]|nr:homoserine dehydrogenase [Candidatus Kaelpia aquatica]